MPNDNDESTVQCEDIEPRLMMLFVETSSSVTNTRLAHISEIIKPQRSSINAVAAKDLLSSWARLAFTPQFRTVITMNELGHIFEILHSN